MQLTVEKANIDLLMGTIILVGVDESEIVAEIGTEKLLNAMEYSDIMEYVAQAEKDKADENE